ncbi:hypothetical protein ACZ90_28520 [Streptomyces albus subsp. albus]|nr:hypothetical protein ACZ90_28520 [Streptomyces albus subsp. albus]
MSVRQGLLPEDPRVLGPYRLLTRWSEPAAGAMYLGRDRELTPAVLCVLPGPACEAAIGLGLRPVPGVPAVRELSTEAEPRWAALAYTPAVPLSEVVGAAEGTGVLAPDQVAALGGAVAATLAALHARGIGYGAVSPEGVWLTTGRPLLMALHACRSGPDPEARAGVREEPVSRVSTVPVAYMAPEVAAGATSAPTADVYALGVLLVYAATGRLPFGDGPPPALAYRAVHDRPVLHGIPRDLAEVVTAALAPRPGDRPTAADLVRTPALRSDEAGWPGPPPGRVVAALAIRTQQITELDTDPEESPAPPTELATRLLNRDAPAEPDPVATPHTPATPTRRALVSRLVAGAAGAALGAAGTLAWQAGSDDGRAAAPARATRRGGTGRAVTGLPPTALWRLDDDAKATELLPVTGAGRFLVKRNGTLYGHDLRTGKELWDLPDLRGYSIPRRVSGDRVLVATGSDLKLCSLRDGRIEWADQRLYQRDTTVGQVLATAGDTAWLLIQPYLGGSGQQSLMAFDIAERRERWRTPLPKGFEPPLSVTVAGGTVIVEALPEDDPHRDPYDTRTLSIAGFDRADGELAWKRTYREVYSGPHSSVVDAAGRLFFLALGSAHAYDTATGRRLWKSKGGADAEHGPPLRTGSVLCMTGGVTNVIALDADTGHTRWDQHLDEQVTHYDLGAMAVSSSGRTLYVPTQGQLAALDLESGERLWQLAVVGLETFDPLQLVAAPGLLLLAQPSATIALPTR